MIKYFIGYSAVSVAGISLLPQIYQIIKTKKVEDLNRTYFLLCIMAEFLYATYGFLENDYVMVASTIPPFINEMIVIFLHCKYKNANVEPNQENIENEQNN